MLTRYEMTELAAHRERHVAAEARRRRWTRLAGLRRRSGRAARDSAVPEEGSA